ncbi:MAG: hypothetical protein U1E60_09855 [Reyranellaceae bacterium]
MDDSRPLEDEFARPWRETIRSAVSAGGLYSCLLLALWMLLGVASRLWLVPLIGEAAALAAELTIMLPFAWKSSALVAKRYGIASVLPAGAIAAATTALLVSGADLGLVILLDPGPGKSLLNHGWIEARFVAQMLMAGFPLACQYR